VRSNRFVIPRFFYRFKLKKDGFSGFLDLRSDAVSFTKNKLNCSPVSLANHSISFVFYSWRIRLPGGKKLHVGKKKKTGDRVVKGLQSAS
jgi:hypothetical protein